MLFENTSLLLFHLNLTLSFRILKFLYFEEFSNDKVPLNRKFYKNGFSPEPAVTYKYSEFMQQIEYILYYISSSMLSDRTTVANKVM